jgi:hypothetical protein
MDDDPEPREVYDALLAYRIRQTIVCVGFKILQKNLMPHLRASDLSIATFK